LQALGEGRGGEQGDDVRRKDQRASMECQKNSPIGG
jgi:hypothetical protein